MRRFTAAIAALALAAGLLAIPAAADGVTTYSDAILPVIEEFEGFETYQYEDPVGSGNYFIGFGTGCAKDAYPDGVTREQAQALLAAYIDGTAVPELNAFLSARGISLNRNQYDALISFTYNLGGSWMNGGNRLSTYLTNGISNYTDAEIADAIGVFAHAGGAAVGGLVDRRIREAQIFLYGDYTGYNSTQFDWLIVDRNGGELENDIFCYEVGKPYGALPQPTLAGMYFAGWQREDGVIMRATDIVSGNVTATAAWSAVPLNPFTDISESDWFYTPALYCYENGLISGTGTNSFAPRSDMTRAMLVTILWRLAGSPTVNYAVSFSDVPEGRWYTEAVRWAAANGVTSGLSAELFGTDNSVTREQMVTILLNCQTLRGGVIMPSAEQISAFADAGSVSAYALDAMNWAVAAGIISGTGAGLLNPQGSASRAEAAQVLMQYTQL